VSGSGDAPQTKEHTGGCQVSVQRSGGLPACPDASGALARRFIVRVLPCLPCAESHSGRQDAALYGSQDGRRYRKPAPNGYDASVTLHANGCAAGTDGQSTGNIRRGFNLPTGAIVTVEAGFARYWSCD